MDAVGLAPRENPVQSQVQSPLQEAVRTMVARLLPEVLQDFKKQKARTVTWASACSGSDIFGHVRKVLAEALGDSCDLQWSLSQKFACESTPEKIAFIKDLICIIYPIR